MKKNIVYIIFSLVMLGVLYLSSLYNYLLFHTLAELFSIIIAFCIFIIAWNSRDHLVNKYLMFIGIAYLFIGFIDLFHAMGYAGLNIFRDYDANLPTQLWILARYMESISLFFGAVLVHKKLKVNYIICIYSAITLILGGLIFQRVFPDCFVEGRGLTLFKKISEYAISLVFLLSIFVLIKRRKEFDVRIFKLLVFSIALTIVSELAFTFYVSVYGFSNLVGHYCKIISFYLIYEAVVKAGFRDPYALVFRELKINEKKLKKQSVMDPLTGLFNRRAALEFLKKMIALSQRTKNLLTISFVDIDKLKKVNDHYGHLEGDVMIKTVAALLKESIRDSDYACRIGGDEFLLILLVCSEENAEAIMNKIKEKLHLFNIKQIKNYEIDFSYGFAVYDPVSKGSCEEVADKLMAVADKKMYEDKARKKNTNL